MQRIKWTLLLVVFLTNCWVQPAFAQQPSSVKKAQQAYVEAGKSIALKQWPKAITALQKAIEADPTFATAYQQLGDIYRRTEQYEEAVVCYEKVLEIAPGLTALTHFGLGESLLFTGKYQQAQQQLEQYKKINPQAITTNKLLEKYLVDCHFALIQPVPGPSLLQRLNSHINTEKDEYYPKLTADNAHIIFTRKENNQENFYESQWSEAGWGAARKLPEPVNTEKYNEGAHCISPDGKYLFFTGCNRPDGLGSCDLYVSKLENGQWSQPFNLGPGINTKGWESQPAISADGKTLYFVSNRPGGQGGYDIWKSDLQAAGQWSKPQNLGPHINSPFDEGAPYLHADNKTLYFSSNGWPGFGKNDIFKSTLNDKGQWSEPENMGAGINNYLDQRSFHISLDGSIAHLASQDSLRQWDIFSIELPTEKRPPAVAYIAGTVFDKNSKQPIQAQVSVTNTQTKKLVFEKNSDLHDGQFIAVLPVGSNYAVHIQKQGYLFDSKQYAMDQPDFANKRYTDSIYLEPIQRGAISTLRNIYFDSDKYDLLPNSESELLLLYSFLKSNPSLRIELAGHTDNTGNKEANMQLSENRAKAVADYLKSKGIAANRLLIKGYGDTQPVATNDTEEGKQLNRRTTFSILSF